MKKILALCILGIFLAKSSAYSQLGAGVHFENQVSNSNYDQTLLPPVLAHTPVTVIRDGDAPNWRKYELSQGVYTLDATEQGWIDTMSAKGYSIVFCPGFDANSDYTPLFYPLSPFPATQFAAFCKWFVQTELARGVKIAALEIINEPNNVFATAEGATWESQLVSLSNMVADALHSLNPSVPVIGLGAQGQQILDMLAMTPTHLDGIVYHGYIPADGVPEHADEWWTGQASPVPYLSWIDKLQGATSLDLWQTEWADNANGTGVNKTIGSRGELHAAIADTRRLVLDMIKGIKHTFLYQFSSWDTIQSIVDYDRVPRAQMYSIDDLFRIVNGLSVSAPISESPTDANFYGYSFSGSSASAAIAWIGNSNPTGDLLAQTPATYTLNWSSPTAPSAIDGYYLGSRRTLSNLPFTYSGGTVTVPNVPVGPDPIALIPAQCAAASPTPTPPVVVQGPFTYTYPASLGHIWNNFKNNLTASDTIIATGNYPMTSVSDNNGDTYTATSDPKTWIAMKINGESWGPVTVSGSFATAESNPSLTITEQRP